MLKSADDEQDYDHSYYFISTFSTDHVNHAAKYLFAA
jgi:S-formylglutathione hydrolase